MFERCMWIWASWIKPNYAWKRVEQAERAANALLYNYVNAIVKRPKPDCFATCCKVLCSMYPPYRVNITAQYCLSVCARRPWS